MSMSLDTVSKPPLCGSISTWLGAELATRALNFARASRDQFKASDVGHGDRNRIDLSYRRSSKLKPIGELENEVREDIVIRPGMTNYRVISAVYYFHRLPKSFSGGVLRIHPIGGEPASFVDIEPANDKLIFFPSWVPHEVMPVVCPSGRFEDSRFALNCWVYAEELPRSFYDDTGYAD
jgi:hypothetical protein